MKYIVFFEFCPEDFNKVIEKFLEFAEDSEKHPEKYPEILFPSHSMAGETKGFEVVEATPDQIANDTLFWMELVTLKFVPIFESAKIVEKYLKSK